MGGGQGEGRGDKEKGGDEILRRKEARASAQAGRAMGTGEKGWREG